ncbi:MAG: tRNA(Ile)(2)-agmatinylcytidine synthase [Candidatus Thermoplasmatota archaeon]|nr:tRNA(Ile)(2)-agmatinylcytidine synthase [Candidatus Thermoplasmatota archaeon]
MYIGIDDTDSVKGGCTTYLATEIIREFQEYDVIGYPRLVRLNPNIPWKTRGNGAVSIRLGEGVGKRFFIGEIGNKKYYGYSGFKNDGSISMNDVKKRLEKIMNKYAFFDDKNTNPAFVVMDKKPKPGLYWDAVRKIVNLDYVKKILKQNNATYHGYKNKRGLIGAASAVSWRPKDKTYEIITYREKKKIGCKRKIDEKSVIKMDKKFSFTFNNYDYKNKKIVVAPNSPCPILFGVRGDKSDLIKPMKTIKSEKIDRYVIFETNQGTDEHLQKKKIRNIKAYDSVIVKGTILEKPRTITGGHVIFSISQGNHQIDCAAYEPTKNFRNLIRELMKDDVVTVFGGVREKPLTVNIEKIKIEKLSEVYEKIIPSCPKCGKKMKSVGKNQGYRCRRCGIKTKKIGTKKIERKIKTGFYEVPVCARRHLSKPLKRF